MATAESTANARSGASRARLDRSRLPQLGELELKVLEFMWRADDANAKQVHASVGRDRGITLNTVASALARLTRKHLIAREKVSHSYRYRTTVERDTFVAMKILEVVASPNSRDRSKFLAVLVDLVAQSEPGALKLLERLVKAKRNEKAP